jgi:hypothetical protein
MKRFLVAGRAVSGVALVKRRVFGSLTTFEGIVSFGAATLKKVATANSIMQGAGSCGL